MLTKSPLPLLQVTGYSPPRPCVSFAHFNFDSSLLDIIKKSEFTTPTPIQSQAIPTVLSGRDIIGVAKTGSGKTAAYLWPLLVHCMDQDDLVEGEGPIGLICSPTRELCQQVRSVGLLGCTLDPVIFFPFPNWPISGSHFNKFCLTATIFTGFNELLVNLQHGFIK